MIDQQRNPHQVNARFITWKFVVAAIVFVVLVATWPLPRDILMSEFGLEAEQEDIETPQPEKEVARVDPFDWSVGKAAQLDREGERQAAHDRYQNLLQHIQIETVTDTQRARLLGDAAMFYLRGSELAPDAVEKLFNDAYQATPNVPANIYILEGILSGLEKHYLAMRQYRRAADQTRRLLSHYQQVFGDNESTLYAFKQLTMMRLANNLMKGEFTEEARAVYQEVMEMTRERGQGVTHIEQLIANTYLPEEQRRSPRPTIMLVPPPGFVQAADQERNRPLRIWHPTSVVFGSPGYMWKVCRSRVSESKSLVMPMTIR